MKRTLLTLVALSSLCSLTASADPWHRRGRPGRGFRHGEVALQQPAGHYELRTTYRFVPGAMQQVWDPGTCGSRWARRHFGCVPGHYELRPGAGHYETVQENVWVPDPPVSFGVQWSAQQGQGYQPVQAEPCHPDSAAWNVQADAAWAAY